MRDEPTVCCHVAGVVANLCMQEEGREIFASISGVRQVVETMESSEDDAQSCACCVALLNACHQHLPSREQTLECGGINALVMCLASDTPELKAGLR